MATTPAQSFPYPVAGDDPNIPDDLMNLAKAIEKRVVGVYASEDDRNTKTVAAGPDAGMFAITKDTTPYKVWYYNGTVWVAFPPAQPAITSGTAAPTGGADGDIYFKV